MYTRWFSQSIRAEALFTKLRPGSESFDAKFKNVGLWFGSCAGLMLVFFALIIGVLSLGEKKKDGKADYVALAGLVVVVCGGAGLLGGGYALYSNSNLKKRIFAFDDATKKYDVKHCGNVLLTEDYRIPLFHEAGYHDIGPAGAGKKLNAWLCGKWKEDEFAWLEGHQLVDPMFRGKDNAAINLALLAALGGKGNKQNRLKWKSFETVVFSEELPLPDIVLGHSGVVETSYTKKALKGSAQPLPGMPMTAKLGAWGATSDPRGARGIYGAIADIFQSRNCLIQVLGGRVIVFVNYYGSYSGDGTSSLKELEGHMDFAHTIFMRLKLIAQAQASGDVAALTSDASTEVFKTFKGKQVSVGKIAGGLCLSMMGLLSVIGMWSLSQERPTFKNQIEAEGLITECSLVERESNVYGRKIVMARPLLKYAYRVDGQEYESDVESSNPNEFFELEKANAIIAKYSQGMAVKVYVDGDEPDKSSLLAGKPPVLKGKGNMKGQFAISAMMVAGGLCLVFFGLFNPQSAPVIPDTLTGGGDPSDDLAGELGSPPVPIEPPTFNGIPAPVVTEADYGNLSSAKYFQNNSFGTLD